MKGRELPSYSLARSTLLATALWASAAGAEGPDTTEPPATSMFSLSGFGTLGVVHSNEDQADFTSDTTKPDGAGYTRTWSAAVDSLAGAQVTATITPELSGVLQVIAEQNYDGTYTPHVEWANLKYEFSPDVNVRAGRIRLPGLLLSDARKVAYTYTWVRPPLEVYGLAPISYSDGVDISYRGHAGALNNTLQVNYGKTDTTFPGDIGTAEARNLWGVSNTVEYGALTARLTYQVADVTFPSLSPLFDQLRGFGPEGIAIADTYEPVEQPARFLGVGASFDTGQWFVTAEWGSTDTNSILGRTSGWYVGGGYRIRAFTPYVNYAALDGTSADAPGLTIAGLPPDLVDPATMLNAALDRLQEVPAQKTITVGGRWDLAKNFALKVQLEHLDLGSGSAGRLVNIQPGFQPGGQVTVFSTSVDFVF